MTEFTYISEPEDIMKRPSGFGNKTLRLVELIQKDIPIPRFVGISSEALMRVFTGNGEVQTLMKLEKEIQAALPVATYAVRSSGLSEDGDTSAHAGEFRTELAIDKDGLGHAIIRVVQDAQKKNVSLSEFSVLVQEYITPAFAGVLFTRNPLGGRESVIEYHAGTSTDVVSGKKSTQILFIRGTRPPHDAHFRFAPQLAQSGLAIESIYGHPQDIEWACDGRKLWILQARPITTLDAKYHTALLLAEQKLVGQKEYYLERSELAASYPTPTRLQFDILSHITSAQGPLTEVYAQFGINRKSRGHLVLICGQMYIDKEKELKEFFPALSFFRTRDGTPNVSSILGLFRTHKNTRALGQLPISSTTSASLAVALQQALATQEACTIPDRTAEAFNNMMAQYPLIFTINLLSFACFKKVSALLPDNAPPLAAFDAYKLHGIGNQTLNIHPPKNLVGNSLDIADETAFIAYQQSYKSENSSVAAWCEAQDPTFMNVFEQALQDYKNFELLRESARWLTVSLVHTLRQTLRKTVEKQSLEWNPIFYECTLNEFLRESYDTEKLRVRSNERTQAMTSLLPNTLSSFTIKKPDTIFSVSSGKATGVLLSENTIRTYVPVEGQKVILLTETLHPGLVAHFPKISGIVSREGNLLSHLAIMAREAHIPVIVCATAHNQMQEWTHVYLDADAEKISVLT